MVLHFVIDEKVTDQIIENFIKVDPNCKFLVFVTSKEERYKYITKSLNHLIPFSQKVDNINSILNDLTPGAILMHAFHLEFAKSILEIKKTITIAWYIWGFDVYGLPRIKPHTYAQRSNEFLLKQDSRILLGRAILKSKFTRQLYFKINTKEEDRYSIIFEALEKINYFVTYLEEDFRYFSKYYKHNLKFLYCPFSTIDQYLGGNKKVRLFENAENILIGNSNSVESNHLDALSLLENTELGNSKVYVPLSYVDHEEYKNKVIEEGTRVLGLKFIPILNFMDRKEYITMLCSCSTGIFYHYRQQAMGNIIAMLYLGARIYLSHKNPAFSFFTKNQIKVFDLNRDFDSYRNSRLENAFIEQNRRNLELLFNETKVLQDIESLIKTIA